MNDAWSIDRVDFVVVEPSYGRFFGRFRRINYRDRWNFWGGGSCRGRCHESSGDHAGPAHPNHPTWGGPAVRQLRGAVHRRPAISVLLFWWCPWGGAWGRRSSSVTKRYSKPRRLHGQSGSGRL